MLLAPFLFRVWDLETGECRQTLEGHSKAVTSIGITPDGRTAISGSDDNTVRCGACGLSAGSPLWSAFVYRVVLVFVD